ncbi:MAG: hypothetical protein AAF513_14125, partial [Pseudomonadota bacterium]
ARQLAADAGPKSQRELAKNVLTFHRLTKTRGFTVRDLEGLTAQMTQEQFTRLMGTVLRRKAVALN